MPTASLSLSLPLPLPPSLFLPPSLPPSRPRVRYQCTLVLQNMFDISDDDFAVHTLKNYLDDIFDKLVFLIQVRAVLCSLSLSLSHFCFPPCLSSLPVPF